MGGRRNSNISRAGPESHNNSFINGPTIKNSSKNGINNNNSAATTIDN